MHLLDQNIQTITQKLGRGGPIDLAAVTRSLAEITQVSHRFMQLLPRIAAARAAQIDAEGALTAADSHQWGLLNSRISTTRTWVSEWPQIERLVRSQISPKRQKLFRRPDVILQAQEAASDAVFNELHGILNTSPQDEASRDHGCFADISLPNSVFIAHLHAARRVALAQGLRHPLRFLDVGCGGGLKVLSARQYFEQAAGLEFDKGYVAQAEALFAASSTGGCHVIHADGLLYEGYDTYDVIYFYRPMRDMDLLRQLEHQITKHALRGTLIIAPYKMFDYRFQEMGCAHLAGRLYIVGYSKRDAARLRRKAELIGPDPGLAKSGPTTVWDPILAASRQRGYGVSV